MNARLVPTALALADMFGIPAALHAGYAALGTDYSEGSGLSRFEWDMILHGPVLALTPSF